MTGIGNGFAINTSFLILGEIQLLKWKGPVNTANVLTLSIAWFVVSGCFYILNSTTILMTLVILPLCNGILIYFCVAESPLWLAKEDRLEDMDKSIKWYRGEQYKSDYEIQDICNCIRSKMNWSQEIKELKSKRFLYGLTASVLIMFFQVSYV